MDFYASATMSYSDLAPIFNCNLRRSQSTRCALVCGWDDCMGYISEVLIMLYRIDMRIPTSISSLPPPPSFTNYLSVV
jgi:hypothetical protein